MNGTLHVFVNGLQPDEFKFLDPRGRLHFDFIPDVYSISIDFLMSSSQTRDP